MIVAQTLKHKESAARAASSRGGKIGGGNHKGLRREKAEEKPIPKVYSQCLCEIQIIDGVRWTIGNGDCPKHFWLSAENSSFNRIRSDASPAKRHRGAYGSE